MKTFFHAAYTLWGIFWFWLTFLALYPAFLLVIWFEQFRSFTKTLNKIWAFGVYGSTMMPVKTEWRFSPDKKQPYVYCANHNSYLDIPLIGYTAKNFVVFIGKSALAKVPIFGYMFRNIHIPVDRHSLKDRYRAFEKAKDAIDKGWSVLVFPEGSINKIPPKPARFKDGAFRIAIEKQVPIVPVTIPYHWLVWHGTKLTLAWHKIKIIYHEPIETKGMKLEDANLLKDKVYQTIAKEIERHFPHLEHSAIKQQKPISV